MKVIAAQLGYKHGTADHIKAQYSIAQQNMVFVIAAQYK